MVPGGVESEGPGILGKRQALLELSAELLLDLGVFRFAGEIDDLPGILGNVVEFFARTLGEGEVVEALEAGLVLIVHQ